MEATRNTIAVEIVGEEEIIIAAGKTTTADEVAKEAADVFVDAMTRIQLLNQWKTEQQLLKRST